MSNIPLTVLAEVNAIEKSSKLRGEVKKELVMNEIRSILDDNIDMEKLVSDLIELLIDISRKQVKLAVNKTKKFCIG